MPELLLKLLYLSASKWAVCLGNLNVGEMKGTNNKGIFNFLINAICPIVVFTDIC